MVRRKYLWNIFLHYKKQLIMYVEIEYREWIMNDINFVEIMMLPYEAYTNKLDPNYLDD